MGDTTLRQALEGYKFIYMPYRNFAERTREEYANDLEDFVNFAERAAITRAGELGLPVIHRYVANLEERGFSSLTRKRKAVVVRSFLLFLYQDEYLRTNLAGKIAVPFIETTRPHILTEAECGRLRKACAKNARDAAIIEISLQTGIRLSELTKLTLDDLDLVGLRDGDQSSGGYVRIVGGRRRTERIIPLGFTTCGKLRKYLSVRGSAATSTVFLNRFGKPLGDRGVQKVIRKYTLAAQIGTASIHTLRHTFAVQRVAQGVSLVALRKTMGNSDRRSTAIYSELGNEILRVRAAA